MRVRWTVTAPERSCPENLDRVVHRRAIRTLVRISSRTIGQVWAATDGCLLGACGVSIFYTTAPNGIPGNSRARPAPRQDLHQRQGLANQGPNLRLSTLTGPRSGTVRIARSPYSSGAVPVPPSW